MPRKKTSPKAHPAPQIDVILGRGGAGKSFLARRIVQALPRVLFHDTVCEPENEVGSLVVDEPLALVQAFKDAKAAPLRVCWRGAAKMGDAAFEFANRVAWAAEDLTVVWEEIDNYADAGRLPEYARRIVAYGRHRRIGVVACARRPAWVSRTLTANAARLIVFRTIEPLDLDYCRRLMGNAAAEKLHGLAPRHALVWDGGNTASVKKSPFS